MSGIAGILNHDGAPVDSTLLSSITNAMRVRGPDQLRTWLRGNAGLGHALLLTSPDQHRIQQPITLDGHVWLTADARIDARKDLLSKLVTHIEFAADGRSLKPTAEGIPQVDDAELILWAYHAWGEECVKYLSGDFAFAIWDSLRRRLFCARDHFGVKPFYYAATQKQFVFSSSPQALRLHPAVSSKFNDNAIADYLLFDFNLDASTSAFADIKRLPPAHSLTVTADRLQVQSYWTLPILDELQYKDRAEYVEQFSELMKAAVADRTRNCKTSIFLSGGLDSSVVASFASELNAAEKQEQLKAFTYVYDTLMPDREREFSTIVAGALGISITHVAADDARLYDWPRLGGYFPPEIINEPLRAFFCDFISASAKHARVVLTGDGGDALLYPEDDYLKKVITESTWRQLYDDLSFSYANYGRVPRIGFRSRLRKILGAQKRNEVFGYPEWLNPNFETTLGLRERWSKQENKPHPEVKRRKTYESLRSNMWLQLFADYDPDTTCSSVEMRFPFFDLRVVNFLLRLPSLPWCFEKGLLRAATKRRLPPEIRKRSKTQIVADPIQTRVQQPEWRLEDHFRPVAALSDFIRLDQLNKDLLLSEPGQIWKNTRPLGLNHWLRSLEHT